MEKYPRRETKKAKVGGEPEPSRRRGSHDTATSAPNFFSFWILLSHWGQRTPSKNRGIERRSSIISFILCRCGGHPIDSSIELPTNTSHRPSNSTFIYFSVWASAHCLSIASPRAEWASSLGAAVPKGGEHFSRLTARQVCGMLSPGSVPHSGLVPTWNRQLDQNAGVISNQDVASPRRDWTVRMVAQVHVSCTGIGTMPDWQRLSRSQSGNGDPSTITNISTKLSGVIWRLCV